MSWPRGRFLTCRSEREAHMDFRIPAIGVLPWLSCLPEEKQEAQQEGGRHGAALYHGRGTASPGPDQARSRSMTMASSPSRATSASPSSTTRPTANTIASKVSRLIVKPHTNITIVAPTSDKGMATTGTRTERSDPINRNIIKITKCFTNIKI